MTDKVSATQADREAAADIWRDLIAKPGECIAEKTMRAGGVMDATPLVQAFARHRTASEQSRVGEGVADDLNGAVVAITQAAIMHMDANEDNDAGHAAFERRITPILTALRASQPTPAEGPLLTLVQLVREYLPPDGISKDEFINRVLEVLDNDEMAELVGELEGRK